MNADVGALLAELEAANGPAATQFDDGPGLGGELTILPSAFNPPTLAHADLLFRALEGRAGAPVALLTTRNVDKGLYGATLTERVRMLQALRGDWPELRIAVSNQARIIDQAVSLRRSFPGAGEFTFVVGFDTLERLFAPRYYDDMEAELAPFFEHSRVIASNRGAISVEDVVRWVDEHAGRFGPRIGVVELGAHPASLSSTAARAELAGGGAHTFVPEAVREYIERAGLYHP